MYDKKLKKQREMRKKHMLTGGQAKIAAKAPPPNVIDEKDFAVLREEKKKVKPVKAALGLALGVLGAAGAKKFMKKKSTMKPGVTSSKMPINLVEEYKKAKGLQNGGVTKANLGLMFMKKAKDKGAKGIEFLSPLAMLKRVSGRKMGGVAKYKRGSGLDLPVISSVKPGSKIGKGKKTYSSMEEMRKAKGFKPGETPSQFNKRKMALEAGKKALRASTVGKIALGVGSVGVAAQQYLKSKMKKDKKMGGGMIKRVSGGPAEKSETNKMFMKYGKKVPKKMGGGMMQKPMGYKSGTMIKARGCKLGRTKPTKIT